MADETLSLKVNGQSFEGWQDVSVHRTLDALDGSIELRFTDHYPGQPDKWVIQDGDAAVVWIGGDMVCTTWIDGLEIDDDDVSHALKVTGRDKTCDLVDCSAVHPTGSFSNRTLVQILTDLAKPFGITVTAVDSAGGGAFGSVAVSNGKAGREPFKRMALQQGETVFELFDRLARQQGVMAITTAAGNIEVRQPGRTRGGYSLIRGQNVRKAKYRSNSKDRYSDYVLKGQPQGGDFLLDQPAYTPSATAKDPGVTRYRPILIVNEDTSTGASLSRRAQWEATIRAGRARQYVAFVEGWHADSGELYQIDRVVPVQDEKLGVNMDLLVSGVHFRKGKAGTWTELTCVPPQAYSLISLPARKNKRKGSGVDPLLNLQ